MTKIKEEPKQSDPEVIETGAPGPNPEPVAQAEVAPVQAEDATSARLDRIESALESLAGAIALFAQTVTAPSATTPVPVNLNPPAAGENIYDGPDAARVVVRIASGESTPDKN